MIDNKLIELINILTPVEKRACAVYLKSPYHNRRDDVNQLWEILSVGKKDKWTPQQVFELVYPGQTFSDAQWRHLQSFLLGGIESFLAQRAWEKTPLLSDLHISPIYREKNLQKSLEYTLRRAADRLNKMPRDSNYYHWLYQLEWER